MSSLRSSGLGSNAGWELDQIVQRVADWLPAQGPISVFIHHNPLHALEELPFEEAAVRGGRRWGCEPFLAEADYRQELETGRISTTDVEAVVDADLASGALRGDGLLAGVGRRELRLRLLLRGIPDAHGVALDWLLKETRVLRRLRSDLPSEASQELLPQASAGPGAGDEEGFVRELWQACLDAVSRAPSVPRSASRSRPSSRDQRYEGLEDPVNEWVHPVLIRFVSGYLDQGLASWPMPQRATGLYRCFLELYGRFLTRFCAPWGSVLARLIEDDRAERCDAQASLIRSLQDLGVAREEWESFLRTQALSLRGWAGMVWQFEVRPDRVPTCELPARLMDYLAVRLLLTRAVATWMAPEAGFEPSLSGLREMLSSAPAAREPRPADRAWPLFHVAQLFGLDAAAIGGLRQHDITALEEELSLFDSSARRRLLHLAYERRFRHRLFDALAQHEPEPRRSRPLFQAVFCIDEREESFRRHLEEVEPRVETFGTAGFFGVALYYKSAADAHARALCPVAIKPRHYVREESVEGQGLRSRWRRAGRRWAALLDKNIHMGSRGLGRGAVIMAALGVLSAVPLVLRVVLPWSRRGLSRLNPLVGSRKSRLRLDRTSETPPLGEYTGFTVQEMADIVAAQLSGLGLLSDWAPLVFVIGHGSTSLNNPQESAHDCGACGGGRGGPNARAFAQMANDTRVRRRLSSLGIVIPGTTWFVGGQRNTANNDVALFDQDLVPDALRGGLERAKACFETVRRREAHERCRRFQSAPTWLPSRAALIHVQTRATDLAQPRPEFGHATNAVCIVGRRHRTRGLFLDRRAFLVSYDAGGDPEGGILARLLAAVVPVVVGINLEYFFGYVDPTGYGCGTKLPHNVAGLLGVMDGAQSDLRTGLPWQMLEIHEPVRLTLIVEAGVPLLQRLLEHDAALARLVRNRWLFLAAIDPSSNVLHEIDAAGARRYTPEHPLRAVVGTSRTHYHGRRGPLPFVRIETNP